MKGVVNVEFILAGQIIAGLWCKWRHGKEWRHVETRAFPYQGYLQITHNCPRCKGDVVTTRRLSVDESRKWLEMSEASSKARALIRSMEQSHAAVLDELRERYMRASTGMPTEPLDMGKVISEVEGADWPDTIPG